MISHVGRERKKEGEDTMSSIKERMDEVIQEQPGRSELGKAFISFINLKDLGPCFLILPTPEQSGCSNFSLLNLPSPRYLRP
jgi:hypothetical protein